MAWVAFDRAIKSAEMFELDGPLDHWRDDPRHRSTPTSARKAWNRALNAFAQDYGSDAARRERAADARCSASCRREIRASKARSMRSRRT